MKTYDGEEGLAILRVVLARLRSEPEETALEVLSKFAETLANEAYLQGLAECEAPSLDTHGGEEMNDISADLKANMEQAFVQPEVASRTKAMGQTLAEMIAPTLAQGSKTLSTEPLSEGAVDLLQRAGLGDVADKVDGQARAVKAAQAAPGDAAPMLPEGLRGWIAGTDQPPPTEAQRASAEAQAQRMGENVRNFLRGGVPATVARGDGSDPMRRQSWLAAHGVSDPLA